MSSIRLITLDLDNTLWDVDAIIVQAEAELLSWLAQHAPEGAAIYRSDALPEIRSKVLQQHAHASHDLTFLRKQLLFEVMQHAGYDTGTSRRMAEQAFDVFFEGRNRVVFFPGAIEMLQALSERFPVYALTNGNADIHRAGLSDYLRGAYSSADVGVRKPHADMFMAPLQATGVTPQQAVHIGDHLEDDVAGAGGVGMHTIWVNLNDHEPPNPSDECSVRHQPTIIVEDLASIPEAVSELQLR